MKKIRRFHVQPVAQLQNVIGCQDNLDVAAAFGKAGHPGVAAELDPAVQGIFCRQDVARILFFAEQGLLFAKKRFFTHYTFLAKQMDLWLGNPPDAFAKPTGGSIRRKNTEYIFSTTSHTNHPRPDLSNPISLFFMCTARE